MLKLTFSSAASSRLGRALAELFGLLVKLCVGSPVRQRRSHHTTNTGTAPTPAARSTASSLTKLLTKGLSWQPPPYTPTPRFRYSVNSLASGPHQAPLCFCIHMSDMFGVFQADVFHLLRWLHLTHAI